MIYSFRYSCRPVIAGCPYHSVDTAETDQLVGEEVQTLFSIVSFDRWSFDWSAGKLSVMSVLKSPSIYF